MKFDLIITEEDVIVPISSLVDPDPKLLDIDDMADHWDVFMPIEHAVLHWWASFPDMDDNEVLRAYNSVLGDFDGQDDGSLEDEISKSLKAMLQIRRRQKKREYTLGEIRSCLLFLMTSVDNRYQPGGQGYLKYVKAFFQRHQRKVEDEEIWSYIR